MAKKSYLVVIPVNKPAYMKSFKFGDINAMCEIIRNKAGYFVEKAAVSEEITENSLFIISAHVSEKSSKKLPVNERATYCSQNGEEKDVCGAAVIVGNNDGFFEGLSEETANKVMDAVNELQN